MVKRRTTAWLLLALPMGVICLAGVGKSLDIPSFILSLKTWQLVPKSFLVPLALVLPPVEVAVALAWFLGFSTRWAVLGAVVLLIGFTSVYAAHLIFHFHPSCQRAGAIQILLQIRRDAPTIITQNSALVLCLALGFSLWRSGLRRTVEASSALRDSSTQTSTSTQARGRGFTLIELLLVIAIVGIVMALIAPSLTRVRSAAREQVSLANLSSHVKILNAYTGDWKDQLPFFTVPTATWTIVRNPDQDYADRVPYFGANYSWNIALASMYYGGNHRSESFNSPDNPQNRTGAHPDYYYPCVAIATPRYWNRRWREGPLQRVPTTNADVLYPDKKVILVEVVVSSTTLNDFRDAGDTRLRAGAMDGSTRALGPSQRTGSGIIGADGYWPGAMHGGDWPPMHHTMDGMRGRDIR